MMTKFCSTEQEAIDRWNHRPTPPAGDGRAVAWAIFDGDRIKVLVRSKDRAESWAKQFPGTTVTPLYTTPPPPVAWKPIEWTDTQKPNNDVPYTHVIGFCPFGRFLITWMGWKEYDIPTIDESPWGFLGTGSDVEDAKKICDDKYKVALAECLLPPPQSSPVAQRPILEDIRGAVARGWCHENNSHKEMDTDLALAIAEEIAALLTPPQ